MVRSIISLFTICAITAGTAGYMVERAFAPTEKAINLSSINLSPMSRLAVSIPKTKPVNALEVVEDQIEVIELSEANFIPSFEESSPVAVAQKVEFSLVEKSKDLKESLKVELKTLGKTEGEVIAKNEIVEINGEQPVKLYGFNNGPKITESALVANFKPVQIKERVLATQIAAAKISAPVKAELKKTSFINDKSIANDQDRISTALAATEKSTEQLFAKKNVVESEKAQAEELVFFDYSSDSNSMVDQKNVVAPVNNKGGVAKAMPKKALVENHVEKVNDRDKLLGNILKDMGKAFEKKKGVPRVAAAGKQKNKNKKVFYNKESIVEPAGFRKKLNTQNHKSVYRLTTQSQALNGKSEGKISNFEVRFADDIDDIQRADSTGIVEISNLLNSDYAVRRGTVLASGHYPTTTDFVLEGQHVNLTMPLVTEESFNNMLSAKNLRGLGAHVLVELDELTEDVEFDLETNYEAKLYLDRTMRVVEREDSDFSFILFVGVEPGNKIISFKTYKNQVTSKIVHLAQDEIYFDFNFYAQIENDEFEFYEEHLLSKETGILSVDEKEIEDLSFDTKFVKKTVNRIQAKSALYPVGTRKYYELRHLNESVFVGRWASDYVDVPSESYIRFALSNFNGYSLEDSCLVQINIEKQAKELTYNGQSFRGHMRITPRILDTDGVFYKDLSDQSKRIFLLGEEQGTISVKVRYVDNSVDYLQTFCSKSNYVVEQL